MNYSEEYGEAHKYPPEFTTIETSAICNENKYTVLIYFRREGVIKKKLSSNSMTDLQYMTMSFATVL